MSKKKNKKKTEDCKHQWAPLIAKVGKKTIPTLVQVCLKCGDLQIGKRTIRISRYRLDMGGKPIKQLEAPSDAGDALRKGTRLTITEMPDMASEKIIVGQGIGNPSVVGDPIPKATDESGSFTYTTGYGTNETDISALFTTPLIGTTRKKYPVYLDLTNFEADANFAYLYVAVKAKVDGTNYRAIDRKTIAKADIAAGAEPGVVIMIPPVARDVQITFQMSATLALNRVIYYHYVKEFFE